MNYDCIIVGAGPTGIFAAYEFLIKKPSMKLLLLDKGQNIYKRSCPILNGKTKQCPKNKNNEQGCMPSCSITGGFGGSGAFSDGKFNITTEFGGWLTDYLSDDELLGLINYVDSLNIKHGAKTETTNPNTEAVRIIEKRAYGAGLKLLRASVRHLGTEQNLEILKSIYEYFIASGLDMRFGAEVADIIVENGSVHGVVMKDGEKYFSDAVIIAPGRDGSSWLTHILTGLGLTMINNQVDVGVRCEVSDIIMQDINKHLYEGKFVYKTSLGTSVRTFCANPSGHVVVENHSGVMAANGHAYKDPSLGSKNTNFALLVSHKFTEPFNKPNEYAREICKRANDLSNGSVIVQKFGDILKKRRSTEKRIREGFLTPTLKEAVPGDLGLVLPYNTMKCLIETVYALDKVTPGIYSEHTLFYGVEAKFYSARPSLKKSMETDIKGLYCSGDGAGVTRGLAQAGAAGVWIARNIINEGTIQK